MKRLLILPALAVGLLLWGCGGDGDTGTEPPTYENIAGTYVGEIAGVSQGITLEVVYSLTIQQSSANLTGTGITTGTLTDGVSVGVIQGTGTLTGTIASGNNPSLTITTTSAACPNYSATFTGAYDSTNHEITLSGDFEVLDNCQPILNYPSTIIMRR